MNSSPIPRSARPLCLAAALAIVGGVWCAVGEARADDAALRILKAHIGKLEAALGAKNEETLLAKHRLALELSIRGERAAALEVYRMLLADTAGAPKARSRRLTLLGLGSYFVELNDPDRGRPLLEEGLELATRAGDAAASVQAYRWLGLADLRQGKIEGALRMFQRGIESGKVFATTSPLMTLLYLDYAQLIVDLPGTLDVGPLRSARAVALRALDLREQDPRATPTDVAHVLLLAGSAALKLRDWQNAERELTRAYRIAKGYAGANHPRTQNALRQLRVLAAAKRDLAALVRYGALYTDGLEAHFSRIVMVGSEAQRLRYSQMMEQSTWLSLTLEASFPDSEELRRQSFLQIVRQKGRVLEALVYGPRASANLAEARARLALHTLRGPRGRAAAWEAAAQELKKTVDELEQKELTGAGRRTEVTIEAIAQTLPAGTALVEIAQYRPHDPLGARLADTLGDPAYRAYVLRSDGKLRSVHLGNAEKIDRAVRALRRALSQRGDVAGPARALDALTLERLEPALIGADSLLVSAASDLTTVPFDALIAASGEYRVKRFEIGMLTTSRDLLRASVEAPRGPPTIVVDPLFGERGPGAPLPGVLFETLPGTKAEGALIAARVRRSALTEGVAATEAFVKGLRGPQILHIGTHGFFLSADDAIVALSSRGVVVVPTKRPAVLESRAAPSTADPLLRAGLAFAGANFGGKRDAADDGILTGLEAAGLDLRGTRLVVLSACETGLGESRTTEGVFGLSRAFAMAGAEQLVLSLWKVDDGATAALMVHFYERLSHGDTVPAALRAARLRLLASPKTSHPFFWSAFVASGKPTAL